MGETVRQMKECRKTQCRNPQQSMIHSYEISVNKAILTYCCLYFVRPDFRVSIILYQHKPDGLCLSSGLFIP